MRLAALQHEADLRIPERELRDEPRDLRGLRGIRLQKLSAGRQIEEQIRDLDERALPARRPPDRRDRAAVDAQLGASALRAGRVRSDETRHRRDGRQRLAAEPERADRARSAAPLDLARRVALDRQQGILRVHAVAIVFDANRVSCRRTRRSIVDAPRAGVDGVLDELLDDRRGRSTTSPAAIWFARLEGKAVDAAHRRSSWKLKAQS